MSLAIIILAAGKGTRMESDLAKVLHPLCGKPLVAWVLEATRPLAPQRTVVIVGHQADVVEATVREQFPDVEFALQPQMLGTGHAVQQAEALLKDFEGEVIVTCGDAPLITTDTLRELVAQRQQAGATAAMLVATVDHPTGYGRVLLAPDGGVTAIVEQKDATPEIAAIHHVNAGTYCFDSSVLWHYLSRITNNNRQGEYYLTDIVGLLAADGQRVNSVFIDEREMTGVNTRAQLQALEAQLRAEGVCGSA